MVWWSSGRCGSLVGGVVVKRVVGSSGRCGGLVGGVVV